MFESTGGVIERILRENEALRLELAALKATHPAEVAAMQAVNRTAQARIAELDRLLQAAGNKLSAKENRPW